jgi:hypothetical protein
MIIQSRRNETAMMEQVWRVLVEATQPNRAGGERALLEHLIAAVAELHLPLAFQERMAFAVTESLGRAREPNKQLAASVTLAVHVLQPEGGQPDRSWGFFLIEKRVEDTLDRRVDVLLYLET